MGFTPIEGAVMATRSGSVDPGLLLYLLESRKVTITEMIDALYRKSGLAGMSGTTGDLRGVLSARNQGDHAAKVAVSVYLHRLRREIGAIAMSMDRLDAVVFTGGVAEHQPSLISELVSGLSLLGLHTDPSRLMSAGDRVISPQGAAIPVCLIKAREDLVLAQHTKQLLTP